MKRLFRFIKALWKYILYGKRTTFEQFVSRLMTCENCPCMNREKWICEVCGCYLDKKAKMSTEKCPKNKW
jgi:hypothetical protein